MLVVVVVFEITQALLFIIIYYYYFRSLDAVVKINDNRQYIPIYTYVCAHQRQQQQHIDRQTQQRQQQQKNNERQAKQRDKFHGRHGSSITPKTDNVPNHKFFLFIHVCVCIGKFNICASKIRIDFIFSYFSGLY